ncbi:mandelate racemase/muconate lactonizing enzyme family protein [Neorhizobium sp. P12A]|uniref:mandelate racemase/muconate lactonizing enzyme family protein n=1 Tax=Neorhizobium sp. P12A TaxID=2268027 RepID=UPI0011EBEB2C|nr:mandelate racemase/muconate lactonizing enzyme family protein [Neorhizobium sp. P12A]KAA0695719.1 mandelate racemase/muconate lactonizing enzyme family protein [Neorhizobium sp. P12A]
MRISELRLYHLSAPLSEPIGNALIFFPSRQTLLVEIVAGGLSGWGEAWVSPGTAAAMVEQQLARHLIGGDPTHIKALWQTMREANEGDGIMVAIAAVDMALHDLTARAYGIPLSSLLGGARRDKVLAYASGPFFKPNGHPYRDFEREIDGYLKEGFRALKLRSGFNPGDDVAAALGARRQIGADADLMIDFNQSCTARRSIATAALMEEAAPLWIEEPVTPTDIQGYRLAANHIKAAIAGGEALMTPAAFRPFLSEGCMDILQPDIAICGGLTGVGQVATLADMYNRPVIPHVWGSTVNFHAALHFISTLPRHRSGGSQPFPYLEYDVGPNPLLELAGRPKVNGDGTVSVPEGAGLGIELNASILEPYTIARKIISE